MVVHKGAETITATIPDVPHKRALLRSMQRYERGIDRITRPAEWSGLKLFPERGSGLPELLRLGDPPIGRAQAVDGKGLAGVDERRSAVSRHRSDIRDGCATGHHIDDRRKGRAP